MKKIIIIAFLTVCAVVTGCAEEVFPITESGAAVTEIVTGKAPSAAILHAAKEFSYWVKEISGAELNITEEATGNYSKCIFLDVLPENANDDMEFLAGTDGYAVRVANDGLHISALRPAGIRNGVFRLLSYNTDIIWARPTKTFFTPVSSLVFHQIDYVDRPAVAERAFSLADRGENAPGVHAMWEIRNNMLGRGYAVSPRYPYAENAWIGDWDFNLYGNEGHAFMWQFLNPAKYFSEHPEYYAMVGGQRVSNTHPCYSNEGTFKVFMEEFRQAVEACPPEVMRFFVSEADAFGGQCQCPDCTKMFFDEEGNSVRPTPATNFYRFLNKVAAELEKIRPGAIISSHAYFSTETAPQIDVAANILPDYCPIFQNMRYPVQDRENNEISSNRLQSWLDKRIPMTAFTYYGLTPDYPRPSDRSMLQDFLYIGNNTDLRGVLVMVHEETGIHGRPEAWDFNAVYYWTMAQACWLMPEDTAELRQIFLDRVFGNAADEMAYFYELTERYYWSAPGESTYQDAGPGMWKQCIVDTGLAGECRSALAAAYEAADKPEIKEWIARMQKTMEKNIAAAALQVQAVYAPGIDFVPGFDSGFWTDIPAVNTFSSIYDGQGQLSTLSDSENYFIKTAYDDENIYVAFCGRENTPLPEAGKRSYCKVEAEIAPDRDGDVFSFSCNLEGSKSDSVNRDPWGDWNSAGYAAEINVNGNCWSIMLTIPQKDIGFEPGSTNMAVKFRLFNELTAGMAYGSVYNWPDLITY